MARLTFGDVVSEEAVVDFGALAVLTHRKRRGARARPSGGEPSNPYFLALPELRPCCCGLAKGPGARHPGIGKAQPRIRGEEENRRRVEGKERSNRGQHPPRGGRMRKAMRGGQKKEKRQNPTNA